MFPGPPDQNFPLMLQNIGKSNNGVFLKHMPLISLEPIIVKPDTIAAMIIQFPALLSPFDSAMYSRKKFSRQHCIDTAVTTPKRMRGT